MGEGEIADGYLRGKGFGYSALSPVTCEGYICWYIDEGCRMFDVRKIGRNRNR